MTHRMYHSQEKTAEQLLHCLHMVLKSLRLLMKSFQMMRCVLWCSVPCLSLCTVVIANVCTLCLETHVYCTSMYWYLLTCFEQWCIHPIVVVLLLCVCVVCV